MGWNNQKTQGFGNEIKKQKKTKKFFNVEEKPSRLCFRMGANKGEARVTARERRKAIIQILCNRRRETRANFASEFGVTTRTIDNDVSLLSIDYPIYTVQGPSGGIFMAEGFDLIKDYLPDKFVIVLEKMTQRLNGEELETVEYI